MEVMRSEHVVKSEHHADHLDHRGNDHWNSMRIDGDDEDHEHEPPMTFSRVMSLIAMGFLWVGSQIPLYLFGMLSFQSGPASDFSSLTFHLLRLNTALHLR